MLYVGEAAERHTNLDRNEISAFDVYVRNAATFLNSCKAAGMVAKVVTNDRRHIVARLTNLGVRHEEEDFIEIEFQRNVPLGIPFRSAHFKFDVFSYLGSQAAPEQSALLDIDCIVLDRFKAPINSLLMYDITQQMVEANGLAYFDDDFRILGGGFGKSNRWYGGEFICGDRVAFRLLSTEIERIWPVYVDNIRRFNYVGDELVTSFAIERLNSIGHTIDPNGGEIVARFWSIETLSRPASLSIALSRNILHLPADKVYLSKIATNSFDSIKFRGDYFSYVSKRRFQRLARAFFKSLLRMKRYYRPILS